MMNNTLLVYLPFCISFVMGFVFILLLQRREESLPFGVHAFLAGGLGLGISAQLTFVSFLIFDELHKIFVIALNLTFLAVSLISALIAKRLVWKWKFNGKTLVLFLALCGLSYPLWFHGHFYAYGGWDAWSTWNLKALFLYLGEGQWKGIFDPLLWRASPHYPLLYPLANVWGWCFFDQPFLDIPILTTFLYSFYTVGLLTFGLYHLTRSYYCIVITSVLLMLPYFVKISISQYCDIVLGFYLLCSMYLLINVKQHKQSSLIILTGLSLGLLSFSKPEGLVAALLILILSLPYLAFKTRSLNKKLILALGISCCFAFLSTLIFKIFYSPGNQTMVNGLFSTESPVSLFRLKIIFSFYLMELISPNWNGLWIVLVAGLLLSKGRCFNAKLLIIPGFILGYAGIISFYYFINTYFEITWWLQVTLHRILYSVLPVVSFWCFLSLWQERPHKTQSTDV